MAVEVDLAAAPGSVDAGNTAREALAAAELASPSHAQCVVVLGASNVARNIATVVETSRQLCGGPVDILLACGHGRSYGKTSCMLGRSLPGIIECGLWDDLALREPGRGWGLVTDVGNDLSYGAGVDEIVDWVSTCWQRLRPWCERITFAELPLASLASLGPLRYYAMRSLLFPGSRLSLHDAMDRAATLNANLRAAAMECGVSCIAVEREWYGLDPIHIRRRAAGHAWRVLLGDAHSHTSQSVPAHVGLHRWFTLRSARPLQRRVLGVSRRCRQPARTLRDGSIVSLY